MIALIEDEEVLQWIVGRVLGDRGYTVVTGATMAEASAIVTAHGGEIDLAIVDIQIADGSGWDVAAQLWAARPETNIIITSGYPNATPPETLDVPAGHLHFLQKPFEMEDLMNAVALLAKK